MERKRQHRVPSAGSGAWDSALARHPVLICQLPSALHLLLHSFTHSSSEHPPIASSRLALHWRWGQESPTKPCPQGAPSWELRWALGPGAVEAHGATEPAVRVREGRGGALLWHWVQNGEEILTGSGEFPAGSSCIQEVEATNRGVRLESCV